MEPVIDHFAKMREHVLAAGNMIDKAIAESGPLERLDLMSAYIIGHLRCLAAGIGNAQEFIKQMEDHKSGAKQPSKLPPPKGGAA